MNNTMCSESFVLADGTTAKCDRKAAPKHMVGMSEAVCVKCYEAWMMMNDHNDNGDHVDTPNCPECGTYDPRVKRKGTSKTAGTTATHTSHFHCEHPRTPAARARCRRQARA